MAQAGVECRRYLFSAASLLSTACDAADRALRWGSTDQAVSPPGENTEEGKQRRK